TKNRETIVGFFSEVRPILYFRTVETINFCSPEQTIKSRVFRTVSGQLFLSHKEMEDRQGVRPAVVSLFNPFGAAKSLKLAGPHFIVRFMVAVFGFNHLSRNGVLFPSRSDHQQGKGKIGVPLLAHQPVPLVIFGSQTVRSEEHTSEL